MHNQNADIDAGFALDDKIHEATKGSSANGTAAPYKYEE